RAESTLRPCRANGGKDDLTLLASRAPFPVAPVVCIPYTCWEAPRGVPPTQVESARTARFVAPTPSPKVAHFVRPGHKPSRLRAADRNSPSPSRADNKPLGLKGLHTMSPAAVPARAWKNAAHDPVERSTYLR